MTETEKPPKAMTIDELAAARIVEIAGFLKDNQLLVVKNQEQYDGALIIGREVRKRTAALEVERTELVGPLNATVKKINEKFKLIVKPLEALEAHCKKIMADYQAEKEAERLEAQRKAEERAARERAEIEEKARLQRVKEEKLRREREEAELRAQEAENEQERLAAEKEAARLALQEQAAGAKAHEKETQASTITAPVIAPQIEKGGVYTVKEYDAAVVDKAAFVKNCLETGRLEYLDIDLAMLSKESKMTKGARSWPGIKIAERRSDRMRG